MLSALHSSQITFILLLLLPFHTFLSSTTPVVSFKEYRHLFRSLESQDRVIDAAMHLLYLYAQTQEGKTIFYKHRYTLDPCRFSIQFSSIKTLQFMKCLTYKSPEKQHYDKALLIAEEVLFHIVKPELTHLESSAHECEDQERYSKEALITFSNKTHQHLALCITPQTKLEYLWNQTFQLLNELLLLSLKMPAASQ